MKRSWKPILLRLLLSCGLGMAVFIMAIQAVWVCFGHTSDVAYPSWNTWMGLHNIDNAIATYQKKNHSLPPSLDPLRKIEGTYFRVDAQGKIIDGWNRPFRYSVQGDHYSVVSYGRDGRPGGIGLDYDLSNTDSRPPFKASPTPSQFLWLWPHIAVLCGVVGIGASLVFFFTCKSPRWAKGQLLPLFQPLFLTFLAALIVAVVMCFYLLPQGH